MKKGTHIPLHFIERATIIIMAADGVTNSQIAQDTGMGRNKVKKWRIRRERASVEINRVEAEQPRDLRAHIESVLSDEHRSGAPTTFSAEQVARIIVMTCQSPQEYNLPVSHWTPSELARQAVKHDIVDSISPRQVGRFLKRKRI
jgi:putative transposase